METDWWVRIPAIRLADAHATASSATSARTYMYEFGWPAPGLGADPPQQLADAMHAGWVSFAATVDPGLPGYAPEGRTTMLFNTESRVVHDPRAWVRELWGESAKES